MDNDSTAALIRDDRIVFGAAEERFSRIKQHAGFPHKSVEYILKQANLSLKDIDMVTYPFYSWHKETFMVCNGFLENNFYNLFQKDQLKSKYRHFTYYARFCKCAFEAHKKYNNELMQNLKKLGIDKKLKRVEHHLAHAAAAFYTSGFQKAMIITLDAYGSGLAGSVSIGSAKGIKRICSIKYPHSLGLFYAQVTEALGFKPTRHEGKIVGLAAYGNSNILFEEVYRRFKEVNSSYRYICGLDMEYCKDLAKRFRREDISAAYQTVLEKVVTNMIAEYAKKYQEKNIVLAGGVTANVKMNQKIGRASCRERV